MQKALSLAFAVILLSMPAFGEVKTLSNNTLKDKGYERLDGTNQFKLGCRHLVRSEDRSMTFRPTSSSGVAIGWTTGNTFYLVPAEDKTTLHGSDGGIFTVTTWRNCVIF